MPEQKYSTKIYLDRYQKLWDTCEPLKSRKYEVMAIVTRLMVNKKLYEKIQEQTTVPWYVVLCIHQKECGGSLDKHMHNGDPLNLKTVRVPAGRPPGPGPFTFVDSAIDALMLKEGSFPEEWDIPNSLQFLEAYNGLGYKKRKIHSPYLWAWSNHEMTGLFVKDGVFDKKKKSNNPGCATLMKMLVIK